MSEQARIDAGRQEAMVRTRKLFDEMGATQDERAKAAMLSEEIVVYLKLRTASQSFCGEIKPFRLAQLALAMSLTCSQGIE